MKKTYNAPQLKTEKLEIGVFGDYTGESHHNWNPIGILHPLFGLCCS